MTTRNGPICDRHTDTAHRRARACLVSGSLKALSKLVRLHSLAIRSQSLCLRMENADARRVRIKKASA